MSAQARRKGRRFESAVAHWLNSHGFPHVEIRTTGVDGPDLTGLPWASIECKNRRNLTEAVTLGINQAIDQAGARQLPVAIVKRPGRADPAEALAVMRLCDWAEMARQWDSSEASA